VNNLSEWAEKNPKGYISIGDACGVQKQAPLTLYEFVFCDCIYESAFATMSVHASKRGAYKAMNRYINDKWHADREQCRSFMPLFANAWKIKPIEVQP